MIGAIWRALQAGKEIRHPAAWKNRQNTTNALFALASVLVIILKLLGVDLPITNEDLIVIAGGLAAILGVVNTVLTTITTKKISIVGKTAPEVKVTPVVERRKSPPEDYKYAPENNK